MNKILPKERKFSGIEQVQILSQTAKREKEIHRLEHDLNASKIAFISTHQDWLKEREQNKQLQSENERLNDEIIQHLSDKIKLGNEVKKLQAALEYYANTENYNHIPLFRTAEVLIDKGSFAQYVLGGRSDG